MDGLNKSVFYEFPVLSTGRLLLRQIMQKDAPRIYDMRANYRVNQFIARDAMREMEDSLQLIKEVERNYREQKAIAWAGILRNGSQIIGTCGLNNIEHNNRHAELGGEMAVEYWGKGIAQEAVETIVNFGLETMHLHTIAARVSPENRGAISILEKLGFRKEGHFTDRIYYDNRFRDMAVYTIVARPESMRNA